MPKQKSSASAGTRKKHAKKAAGKDGETDNAPKQQPKKLQRGQKKLSKAQQRALPKVKQYIPPPKPPAPLIPDPLDGQGLAKMLPAELVVILRRLGKKDDITRRKGLDDLREWVLNVLKEDDEVEREIQESNLGTAIPVWMHNLASLLQSPFHRSATLQLHADLLSISSTQTLITDALSLGLLPGTQGRDILGSWLVAALEEGRRNGSIGLKCWQGATGWGSENQIDLTEQTTLLIEYLSLSILDPPSLHDDIHPSPVASTPLPLPGKGKQKGPAANTTSPPEPDTDLTSERWARYRVGGLVGLEWLMRQEKQSDDLVKLLHNSALWSCLSSSISDGPAFGHGSSPVRRAGYMMLKALFDIYPDELAKEDIQECLASEMLDAIWLEQEATVWEVAGPILLQILNKHKDLWLRNVEENEKERESEDEESDSEDPLPSSIAFDRFLDFVSTVCPSIPQHTYPLLLVILSTLPSSFLALQDPLIRLETLFAHLWSPVDAKLLSTHSLPGQPSTFQAFMRDIVDCCSLLIGRAIKEEENETVEWLVNQVGDRIWKEGVLELGGKAGRRGSVKPELEATIFGQALSRLPAQYADGLMKIVRESILSACESNGPVLPRSLEIVSAVRAVSNEKFQGELDQLVADLADLFADRLATSESATYAGVLVDAMPMASQSTVEKVVQLIKSCQLYSQLSPQVYVSLLQALARAGQQTEVSHMLSNQLMSMDQTTRFAVTQHLAPLDLLASDASDIIAEEAVQAALMDSSLTSVAVTCVSSNISNESFQTILALICTEIHGATRDILTNNTGRSIPTAAIEILAACAKDHLAEIVNSEVYSPALVSLHHLVSLLPRLHEAHVVPVSAEGVWQQASASTTHLVMQDLALLIQDTNCRVEPSVLVDVASVLATTDNIAEMLLPASDELQLLLDEYTTAPANMSLAVVDPLIPCIENDVPTKTIFDGQGRSRAARLAEAALGLIRGNRHLATNVTLMETVLAARGLAQDALAVPGASRGFLDAATPPRVLETIIREAEGALSFLLADFDEVELKWHTAAVQTMKGDQGDSLQTLLSNLAARINEPKDDVAARSLRDVLSRHFRQSGAGAKEGEAWLGYAMPQAENTLAMSVLLAVKPLLLDSKSLETAQNRLASSLSGIPAKQANMKGVPALRLLVASAPPADAPSVFISQQRAMFVLRHLASWLTSDEADDLEEEIEFRIAQLYTELAPVVQDLQGAHWDGIFDLIETGLDSANLEDPASLCLTYQCLLLLQQVRDLCERNKALRATWTAKDVHMSLVFKLFLQCRDVDTLPTRMIQTLLLDLLRDASNVGDDEAGLITLLKSTSPIVQTTAYRLLCLMIKRQTLALVLEVEATLQDEVKEIKLPQGLIDIVLQGTSMDWHDDLPPTTVLSQLLAWLSVLDHFDDASRTIRWAYLDQLNTSGLLVNALLPMLFAMLGVSEVGAWNFGASNFAVDEFYTDLLEPEELADLTPLASHVFYRALITLPSAVRTYYEGLKDRQLSMSMLNYTARHYSPVIIQHEFAALREPAAMAQLTEEGLNIKIASGGGATIAGAGASEAIASYVVDEQPMEIGIRLPSEFPLKGVDVRDLRRVGVPENKWRGWLMSVQQTITSRNGLILEALTVFKKNVSLHFEGVVECAICYSIISLTDRTLPTKPCRTCKNRFHASCLYKWFNSSHTSSCPLCRALF